jgi:hypothetical protein
MGFEGIARRVYCEAWGKIDVRLGDVALLSVTLLGRGTIGHFQ